MRDLARRFNALADPTRLEMMALLLGHGELCVCDFVETLAISQSKASRHLRYLWNAGLLTDRPSGLWVYYRVAPDLDQPGRLLLAALKRILGARDLTEIEARLARWLKQKSKSGVVCKSAARKRGRKTVETKR